MTLLGLTVRKQREAPLLRSSSSCVSFCFQCLLKEREGREKGNSERFRG